jgi:hypothetical protein
MLPGGRNFGWPLMKEKLKKHTISLLVYSIDFCHKSKKLSRKSGEEDQEHLLKREPTQLVLHLRFATDLKGESWLRAATLDDSNTPTPVLHNTSVVV